MAMLLLLAVFLNSRQAGLLVSGKSVVMIGEKPVVVIDSGHGGNDPGKVGVDGSLEKDINLQIALQLKAYLEASDVTVMMTREEDVGLYDADASQKKMSDLQNRCNFINEINPDIVVSIHQNSYHEEEVSGAQVFYYKGSEQGKSLALKIQERFDFVLGEDNTRQVKSNNDYYLFLHSKPPTVIVECGFLSNWKEAADLNDKNYQNKVAWTIHMGIMEYLNVEKT